MKPVFKSTIFLALVAIWLWSTAFAVVKIGLQYQSPLQFAGLRFMLAGLIIFLAFGKWDRFVAEVRQNLRFVLFIAFLQVVGQYSFFYLGMNLIPSALGAMLVGSSPLFIAMVAHYTMKNDRLSPLKVASFLVGVVGIAIITIGRQKVEIKGPYEWLGITLLLINNLFSGYSNVMISRSKKPIHPVFLSSSSLLIGGIVLFMISLPFEGWNMGPFPLPYFLSLGWLSFLSAAAISIWYTLLSRPGVKVSGLNMWKFLIPVLGAWLSWVLIPDEHPDKFQLIAMAVIAISLILLNKANRMAARKEQ